MPEPVPLEVRLWGDIACFTRPENKVERVSYPVMTPSAARGALEAIFWKPEFTWQVREIWVLRPIRYLSVRRNEINSRQTERTARGWVDTGGGYFADEDRAQRHTLALRDVAYVVRAEVALKPGTRDDVAKYRDQFRRRVSRGQCFQQPYFGCREFVASFGAVEAADRPVPVDEDLGLMLHDLTYATDGSGHGIPRFFHARLAGGVLAVPPTGEGG